MGKVDYFKIIHKYIKPGSLAYSVYVPHVVLVTAKALKVARRLGLSEDRLRFIEEVGMLHDIGTVMVDAPNLGCAGKLPYICHIPEGRKILEAEGLPRHALVAERHTGVGVFRENVLKNNFPIPKKDYVAETLEERVVSWADIFYSKMPEKIWAERTLKEARATIARFGERHAGIFDEWAREFGP